MTQVEQGDVNTKNRRWFGLRPWGRHSLVLLVAGLAYVFIGLTYLITPNNLARAESLVIAERWWELEYWYAVFVLVGVLTVISSRWPPTADKWGYMTLTGFTAGWGAFYMTGVIFKDTGIANLGGALIWWLVAFMWWAISGLNNPPKVIVKVVEVIRNAR